VKLRPNTRVLGETQADVLDSLKRHGQWYERCGWVWDTPSGTRRVLESLVRRGLVTKGPLSWAPSLDVYRPAKASA
jgi:DNA-binding IclR family transcriptional regulator